MPTGVDPVPVGTLIIDCSGMASYLADSPPGAMVGKHSSQEGFREAALEVISNQADYGVRIGITADDIVRLHQSDEQIAAIDAVLPAARKLVEMLVETRHRVDHDRHMHIHELAALIDARSSSSRHSSELLARYEKTREYRSAIAMRAVATRRRNAQAANQTGDQGSDSPPPIEPQVPDPRVLKAPEHQGRWDTQSRHECNLAGHPATCLPPSRQVRHGENRGAPGVLNPRPTLRVPPAESQPLQAPTQNRPLRNPTEI